MMRALRNVGVVLGLISSGLFAAVAVGSTATDPFGPERLLIAQRKYEKAVSAFEARARNGECRGAVCEANLAIAFSKLKLTDRALEQARKTIDKLADEPLLTAREANEIGAILFRAPKRDANDLTSAIKAFRFARAHYTGRASNIAFNLAQALQESGKTAEARDLQHELETGILVDPTFAILGDFERAVVEHH